MAQDQEVPVYTKQPIEPIGEPQKIISVRELLEHWLIMIVLWGLLYFQAIFLAEILDRWSDPFYVSSFFTDGGRLAEMIAFALTVVMSLYIVGVTLFVLWQLIFKSFKNIDYQQLIRLNTLALTSFVVYWVIFISFFVRI
ncbi:hypothetical protein IID19_00020 [Patescibacteria group bacterium]|nr:hypothetical protein [Patescibacteria group bacterium]